jgi:hypothetical protein
MNIPARESDATLNVAKLAALSSSLTAAVYGATQVEPSEIVELFIAFAPLFAVVLWLQKDARRTRIGAVQDWGYFLLLAWPIMIPWYVFKTRGRSGWILLLGLIGLILSSWATSFAVPWLIYFAKYTAWYLSPASAT